MIQGIFLQKIQLNQGDVVLNPTPTKQFHIHVYNTSKLIHSELNFSSLKSLLHQIWRTHFNISSELGGLGLNLLSLNMVSLIPSNVTLQTRSSRFDPNLESYISHQSDFLLTSNLTSNTPSTYKKYCAK